MLVIPKGTRAFWETNQFIVASWSTYAKNLDK